MAGSRWLPGLRALLTLSRRLDGIERQLARIADHLEGVTPARALDEAPADLDEVLAPSQSPVHYARVEAIEQQLTLLLGRPPDADEICRALDDLEWGPDDITAHQQKLEKLAQRMPHAAPRG